MKTRPPGPLLASAAVLAVAATVTLVGAAINLRLRPLDGVEGDLIFEASRIRAGLALYTDPRIGALDYGPIPARYYVLYPPLWAAFLALFSPAWVTLVGRLVSALAYWGLLGALALSARPARRPSALLAALFVAGVYALAEFAGSARPDAVAVVIAGFALARSVRKGRLDAVAGALFALAAWTKPNVLGMGVGAALACLVVAPRAAARCAAGALAVSAVVVAGLERASSGRWLEHVVAGTGQPLRFHLFVHHLEARGQFFLAFLVLAGFWAWTARREPGAALALGALAASTAWACVTFAKVGSAANYWMEPCVAAVVVFSRVDPPTLSRDVRRFLTVAVPLQALWMGVGSVRATFESIDANRAHTRLLEHARALCGIDANQLVVGDEPGIEVTLDGRLVAHAFPLTHQALLGRYPLAPWIADLGREEIACVVTAHDRIERPPYEVDEDYDYFALPVRSALAARFAPAEESAGWAVYAARSKGVGGR
jgi:hypothetical protein